MKILSVVERKEVMDALKRKPLDPAAFEKVEQFAELVPSRPAPKRWPKEWNVSNREAFLRRLVTSKLRRCIDNWLATGVYPSGDESLGIRSLLEAGNTRDFITKYLGTMKQSPMDIVFRGARRGVEAILMFGLGREDQPTTIEQAYGEVFRLMLGVLMSDWGERLCKCRHALCGRYFILRKSKPQKIYKHGTFCCDKHRNHTSAVTQTQQRRNDAKLRLIEMAAKYLVDRGADEHWQDNDLLKRRVADAVSDRMSEGLSRLANRRGIRTKWVTRNRVEIESRRRELELCGTAKR